MQGSRLYRQAQGELFQEASEIEKLQEMMEFIRSLTIPTLFKAEHVSIAVPLAGYIPDDKEKMIEIIQKVIDNTPESRLRAFRKNIISL
jgi:transcription termination factor NusB